MIQQLHSLPYRWARRIAIAIGGGTVVLVGIVMIVTPGPAFIVIPAGLGILGLEFAWARAWLKKLKATGQHVMHSVTHSHSHHNDLKDHPSDPNRPQSK